MSISDALTLTPLKSESPAVGSLEEALRNADCPLGRNEWLAEDGRSLTPKGKSTVVEYCWEAQVAVLPYAGDHGLADEVLKCLGESVGPRELAALAAETLAYCHGQDEDGFGPSFQSQEEASKCTGIKKKRGALSATAAASRELLLAALLRTPPEKRAPFLESALPQLRALLRRPPPGDEDDVGSPHADDAVVFETTESSGLEGGGRGCDSGALRTLAFVATVAPLVEDWALQRKDADAVGIGSSFSTSALVGANARQCAALTESLLDAAAAAGALPAGPPPLQALDGSGYEYPWQLTRESAAVQVWDALAELTLAGTLRKQPSQEGDKSESSRTFSCAWTIRDYGIAKAATAAHRNCEDAITYNSAPPVDQDFLVLQPWRFALAVWTTRRSLQRQEEALLALRKERRNEPKASGLERGSRHLKPAASYSDDKRSSTSIVSSERVELLSVGSTRSARYGGALSGPRPWSALGLARLVYWSLRRDAETIATDFDELHMPQSNTPTAPSRRPSNHLQQLEDAVDGNVNALKEFVEPDALHPPLLIGLWVLSPPELWKRIAPHAITLLLHGQADSQQQWSATSDSAKANYSGEDENEGFGEEAEGSGLVYGDAAAAEALLVWLVQRLPPLCLKDYVGQDLESEAAAEEAAKKKRSPLSSGRSGGAFGGDSDDDDDDDLSSSVASALGSKDEDYGTELAPELKAAAACSLSKRRLQPVENRGSRQLSRGKKPSSGWWQRPWRPQVNVEALCVALVDRMVACADASRRRRLRFTLEKLLAAHDAPSSHHLLSALSFRCPHAQASGWLLDQARKRIMVDLNALAATAAKTKSTDDEAVPVNEEVLSGLPFLGPGLARLVTLQLEKSAAAAGCAVLSQRLDQTLAALQAARMVLMRRKYLPSKAWREAAADGATLAAWARAVKRLQRLLTADDPSLKLSKRANESATATSLPAAPPPILEVMQASTSGQKKKPVCAPPASLLAPVAAEPTPEAASFHLALLADATAMVAELLERQP